MEAAWQQPHEGLRPDMDVLFMCNVFYFQEILNFHEHGCLPDAAADGLLTRLNAFVNKLLMSPVIVDKSHQSEKYQLLFVPGFF